MLCYSMLCYAVLCCAVLCCVMLVLCYVCYAMLCSAEILRYLLSGLTALYSARTLGLPSFTTQFALWTLKNCIVASAVGQTTCITCCSWCRVGGARGVVPSHRLWASFSPHAGIQIPQQCTMLVACLVPALLLLIFVFACCKCSPHSKHPQGRITTRHANSLTVCTYSH